MFLAPAQRLQFLQTAAQPEDDLAQNYLAIARLLQAGRQRRGRERRHKRWWVRPCLLRRSLYGQYEKLMVELRDEDPAAFNNFVRMEPASFQELLMRVGPRITKRTTWCREPLEPLPGR